MTWQKIELSGAQVLQERIEAEGIATPEEVALVADIMGYSMETMCAILYARTGQDYLDDEQEEDEDEDEDEDREE